MKRVITVTTPRVFGIARHPHDDNYDEVLARLVEYQDARKLSTLRVALIDLVPSAEHVQLIERLTALGHTVACYFDHHKEEMFLGEELHVAALRRILGNRFHFKTRSQYPSCGRLILRHEWSIRNINVVFFHDDFDGFTALLHGCGLGYRGMLDDSDIIDCSLDHARLTSIGQLLLRALNHLPPYSTNPIRNHKCKQEDFQLFTNWLVGERQNADKQAFVLAQQSAEHEAREVTERLVVETVLLELGRVAFCDFTSEIRAQHIVVPDQWKTGVRKRFGVVLCAAVVYSRVLQPIVCIELPFEWMRVIDLRTIAPAIKNASSHAPKAHRIWIAQKDWDAFLAAWQSRYPKGFNE